MLYIQHVMKTLNILGLENNENNRVLWQIQCSSMIYLSCIENDIEVNLTSMIAFFLTLTLDEAISSLSYV